MTPSFVTLSALSPRVRDPAPTMVWPAARLTAPAVAKLAAAPISTVPKALKVVAAMLPETVTLPPDMAPVSTPVPLSRSSVPPAPWTAP